MKHRDTSIDFIPLAMGFSIYVALLTAARIPSSGIGITVGRLDLFAHVICFAMVAALWAIALQSRARHPLISAWFISVVLGALTEGLQALSAFRTADFSDFAADAIGGGLAILLLFAIDVRR